MDKKKPLRPPEEESLKGFEEFIEGQQTQSSFMSRSVGGSKKTEAGFEHFTFLTNDSERLTKLKALVTEKLPFSIKFNQGEQLIKDQRIEIENLKEKIFVLSNQPDSQYQKSLREIFDSFFEPGIK